MLDAVESIIPDVQNQVLEVQAESTEEEADPRLDTFKHPTKGSFSTYIFANERNTRLFFDEEEGTWVRMPLSWERNVQDVQAMLQEVHAALPDWCDVNEQMLVLRDCTARVSSTEISTRGCHWFPHLLASREQACDQWHSSRVSTRLTG